MATWATGAISRIALSKDFSASMAERFCRRAAKVSLVLKMKSNRVAAMALQLILPVRAIQVHLRSSWAKTSWQRRISGIRGRRVFSEVCVRVPASDMGNSLFCAAVEPHEGLSFSALRPFVSKGHANTPSARQRPSPRHARAWGCNYFVLKKQNCIVFAVGCGRAAYGYRSLSSTGGAKA